MQRDLFSSFYLHLLISFQMHFAQNNELFAFETFVKQS